jgi:protein ImuB
VKRSDSGKRQAKNVDSRSPNSSVASPGDHCSPPGGFPARRLERPTSNIQRLSEAKATQEILVILHKWGIHTLGELAALDREALCARLGPEAVRLWERANGTATRLLKFVQPPETFEESFEFEREIETAEPLLFMLRRFLEQLALRLNGIYLVAQQLTLRITFAGSRQDASAARTYERVFKIPQPTNDVDLLFRMLQTHLENFKSNQPIVAVALTAEPSRPAAQQFGLFETALRNPHQLYETLARLTALLGTDRVGTPILEETHRPDAFRMAPFAWSPSQTGIIAADTAASTEKKPALRRFRPAAAASIFSSENIPVHVQSEAILEGARAIDAASGPYLLSGNWWDEKFWARAEWDLELDGGDVVRAHQSGEKWEVDGIYD